jgi:putative nucleotidyltransferase with HDIG domain
MGDLKPRVMVVDDDPSFGALVAEGLREKGFDVTAFTSPKQAQDAVAHGSFSVAVLDLQMPEMDGIELARHIRSINPDVQVLILTGHPDLESAVEGIHSGIFGYLSKQSLRMASLAHAVGEASERSRLTSENRGLVERLTESNRLLQGLVEVGSLLSGEVHVDRVLDGLVASARELCRAAMARVILFKRHGDCLVIEFAAGEGSDAIRGARLQPGEGIAAQVAETGEALRVERADRDARYSPRCDELPPEADGMLCAPLRHGDVLGAVMVAGRDMGKDPSALEALSLLARQAAVSIDNALHHEHSVNFFTHTCNLLASILDRLDIFEPGHSQAVAALAGMVARALGMSDGERRSIHFAALLHDIGKLGLESDVLKGEGALSPQHRARLQEHPRLGVEILRPITLWEDVLPIVQAHHERWDGKGYPTGLAGEDVPLGARIVSVVDAFDAMTRGKAHGRTVSAEQALAELEACAGTQFDPGIVRTFVAEYRQHVDPLPT